MAWEECEVFFLSFNLGKMLPSWSTDWCPENTVVP